MVKSSKLLTNTVYGVVIGGILVALWLIFRPQPVAVESALVTRGLFEEVFAIDGRVRSKDKTTIVAFANGDIDEIKIKAGDSVSKGEFITVLRWDFVKKIVSPVKGVVVRVYRQSAGPIIRGEPLLDIVDPENLEIVAEPLTSDAIRIKEGATVQVSGIGDKPFYSAKVVNVSRAGFVKVSALGVEEERTEVRMEFVDAPKDVLARLGDNFHVELGVLISKVEDTLKVPLGALFKDQDQWAVYTIENKKAQLKHIEISKKNDREAVVLKGLQEGEKVILFPSDKISHDTSVE